MRAPASVLVLVLSALLALGCRQGEGERCQTTSDCEDGLICSPSTRECLVTEPGTGSDGGVDAPNDAAIDAAVAIDAVAVDAAIDAP
ncbi:MAG: hypothetical protein IPH80_15885 [Myxococcales bacterium]|nr:hypothetical protein [Myxococcales bacterium]MBP6847431.1 hypothetical protein [Kofleriaceae bacterium]